MEKHIDDLHSTQNCVQWFYETSYKDSTGRTVKEYLMNRDGFALLVMSFSNTRDVLQWKLKYIAAFNEMEQKLALAQFDLPRTLPDALRYLANEVEAHEETKLQLAVAKPKADFVDQYVETNGSYGIRETAKSAPDFGESISMNQSIWESRHFWLYPNVHKDVANFGEMYPILEGCICIVGYKQCLDPWWAMEKLIRTISGTGFFPMLLGNSNPPIEFL